MSKIIKSAGKLVKGVVKGIGKTFKKAIKGDIGSILLIAAAVYTGGVALGQWGGAGPLSSIYGKLGPGVATTPGEIIAGETVATGTAAGGATTLGAPSLTSAISNAITPTFASGITPTSVAGSIPIQTGTSGGFISNGLKAAGSFVKDNPLASVIGAQTLAGALAEDPKDAQIRLEEDRDRRAFAGLDPNIGVNPSENRQLRRPDGSLVYGPGGYINRSPASGIINRRLSIPGVV